MGKSKGSGDVDLKSSIEFGGGRGLSTSGAESTTSSSRRGSLDTTVEVEVVDADPPGAHTVVHRSSGTVEDVVALFGGGRRTVAINEAGDDTNVGRDVGAFSQASAGEVSDSVADTDG